MFWKNVWEAVIHILYVMEPVYSWVLKNNQPHMTSDLLFKIYLKFHMEVRLRESLCVL